MEEWDNPSIREIVFKNYRIIYHYDGETVVVLTVVHGSRMIGKVNLESD